MSETVEKEERWAISDIEGLQIHLPEIDPARYFDRREHNALQAAIVAWPALAHLMGFASAPAQD